MWRSGVLNVVSPKGLLRCVFFYVGKSFCLRGGQEHRDLTLSQLKRFKKPDRYIYSEKASKNRQGGLNQAKVEHKTVTIVVNPTAKERCPVFVLDLYISKLPKAAVENDLFYCKPMSNTPLNESSPWYFNIPVGKNMLSKMVPDMCSKAGLIGKKTNHSLCVSGTSQLFEAGVPEKLIQQRTGHCSLEALRMYERVTEQQELAVSKILSGEKPSYEDVKESSTGLNRPNGQSSSSGIQYNNCTVNVYNSPAQPSFPLMIPYGPPPPLPFDHYYYSSTYLLPPVPGDDLSAYQN